MHLLRVEELFGERARSEDSWVGERELRRTLQVPRRRPPSGTGVGIIAGAGV